MSKLVDISGMRFGKLVAVKREPRKQGDKHTKWLCRCDCGNDTVATYINLKTGNTKSCGCNRKPHGMTGSPTWRCWASMMMRCVWKSNSKYNGVVSVDPRYHDFQNFFADLGERPSAKHSVDRIDNARGYEPGNVRWATAAEQARNKSSNNRVTHNGETKVITDWATHFGVSLAAVRQYLRRHGSLDGYRNS